MRRRCCCRISTEPCNIIADFEIHKTGLTTFVFEDTSVSIYPIVSWEWVFSDGQTSNEQHPEITFLSAGGYSATLTVTDDHNCGNIKTKRFAISPCCEDSIVTFQIQLDVPSIGCANCDQLEGVHIVEYVENGPLGSFIYHSTEFCHGVFTFKWFLNRCANINFITGDHLSLMAKFAGDSDTSYRPVATWRLPRPIQPYNCEAPFFLTGGRTEANPGCGFTTSGIPIQGVLATPLFF